MGGSFRQKYIPPKTCKELVERYLAGERDFPNTSLSDDAIEESLPGINLANSSLRIVFSDVDLTGASFRDADLAFTLFDGQLSRTDFQGAELAWARFDADLSGASMKNADLTQAEFTNCRLDRCDFSEAVLASTRFLNVSLASLSASSRVFHEAPSFVDYQTVLKSVQAPRLKETLAKMGMPAVFVEYMVDSARSLTEIDLFTLLQSTFISYGGPDEQFARRLYDALQSNGVRAFFFPEDATPGKKLYRVMRDGVNQFDRVIVICSAASLSRPGVLNEIDETLQREARDGGASYLIPVALDDSIFGSGIGGRSDLMQTLRDRVVADFRNLDADADKFDKSVRKLISALRKDPLRLPRENG